MPRDCLISDIPGFRNLNNGIRDIHLSLFTSLDSAFLYVVKFVGKLSPYGWKYCHNSSRFICSLYLAVLGKEKKCLHL